jgi:heptosyltransferase-2
VKRVLIAHAGALGDFIVTLPAVAALRAAFPRAEFTLLGKPEYLFLVRELFGFGSCRDVRRADVVPMFGEDGVHGDLAQWLGGFDLAVSWLGGAERTVNRNLARLVGRVVAAEPFPPAGRIVHVSDYLLETIRPLVGEKNLGTVPGFSGSWQTKPGDSPQVSPLVVVQPGSSGKRKWWPAGRFAEVARRLSGKLRAGIVLLLGPAEEGCDELVEPFRADRPEIVRGRSLEEVAALLRDRARLYLGNDSGVTHLAALCGAPTVAIFGPTDARVWGPRGSRVRVVLAPGGDLDRLSADEVFAVASAPPVG